VVLSPHVGEPGLDVVRVVDVDPTAGEEPEDRDELAHRDEQDEDDLQEERGRLPEQGRELEQGQNRRDLDGRADDDRDRGDPDHPLDDPGDAEAGPGRKASLRTAFEATEELVGPEPVVPRGALADQVVDLAEHLDEEQPVPPLPAAQLGLDRVLKGQGGVVGQGAPDQHHPHDDEEEQEFDPVPEPQRLSGGALPTVRALPRRS
jgi:hypothetical protein